MARNVIVRLVPRLDHAASNRMTAEVRKSMSSALNDGADDASKNFNKGLFIAAVTAAMAQVADMFVGQINEAVEGANQFLKGVRNARLQMLSPELRKISAEVLKSGVSESSAAEGMLGVRALKGVTGRADQAAVGQTLAQFAEIGGDVEQLTSYLRRVYGRDVGADKAIVATNMLGAIAAREGRDPQSILSAVEQYGFPLQSIGLDPFQQMSFFTDVEAGGFSSAKIGDLLSRAPVAAGKHGFSVKQYLGAMQSLVQSASTEEDAAFMINKFLPGGLSQQPRTQFAQHLRTGGSLFQNVNPEVYSDVGVSLVTGTPAEQLDAQLRASVINNEMAPSFFDALPGGRTMRGLLSKSSPFLAPLGFTGAMGAGFQEFLHGLPLIGEGILAADRSMYGFGEGKPIGNSMESLQISGDLDTATLLDVAEAVGLLDTNVLNLTDSQKEHLRVTREAARVERELKTVIDAASLSIDGQAHQWEKAVGPTRDYAAELEEAGSSIDTLGAMWAKVKPLMEQGIKAEVAIELVQIGTAARHEQFLSGIERSLGTVGAVGLSSGADLAALETLNAGGTLNQQQAARRVWETRRAAAANAPKPPRNLSQSISHKNLSQR